MARCVTIQNTEYKSSNLKDRQIQCMMDGHIPSHIVNSVCSEEPLGKHTYRANVYVEYNEEKAEILSELINDYEFRSRIQHTMTM